jgi:hypothetical protein
MSDDQFTKLFKYMERRFDEIGGRIDRLGHRLSSLEGLIDTVVKRQEIDEHERAVIIHQLDRHDRWHHQAADKLGMKLDYQEQ